VNLAYLAKFLGAYVLGFGVMLLFIAKDPVRYGALVYPAILVGVLANRGIPSSSGLWESSA
jgi:hypothetical protein